MIDLPLAYFINRDDRPDRLAHMKEQLDRLGFIYQRVPAIIPNPIGNFHTPGALGNWFSHMETIEWIGKLGKPAIIFEDDVVIKDVDKMREAIDFTIRNVPKWALLYFFGLPRNRIALVDRVRTKELHGYLVNPHYAEKIARLSRERLEYLFFKGKRDAATYYGNYVGRVLQRFFPCYGTKPIIYQNRKAFGSDTGWMKLYRRDRT